MEMSKKTSNGKRGRPRIDYPPSGHVNALVTWMASNPKFDIDTVSALLKVSRSVIYGWRNGTRMPSRENMFRLNDISGGDVPLDSWRGERGGAK